MSLININYIDVLGGKDEKKVLAFPEDLLKETVKKESLFVIKVDGESMQPVIEDRSLIVANLAEREVVDKGIYLLYYENKMWIKKAKQEAKRMTFISINDAFSHLVYDEADVRVVAKALLSFETSSSVEVAPIFL